MALCSLLGIECEFAAAYILGFILEVIPGAVSDYQDRMSTLLKNDFATVLLVVFVGPFMEELIFRLLILIPARKFMPFFAANILQAVLFGIYHMNLVQGIYAFLLGLFIGYLMMCTESILSCVCFHIMFNLTGLLLDDYMPAGLNMGVKFVIMVAAVAAFIFTLRKLVYDPQTS